MKNVHFQLLNNIKSSFLPFFPLIFCFPDFFYDGKYVHNLSCIHIYIYIFFIKKPWSFPIFPNFFPAFQRITNAQFSDLSGIWILNAFLNTPDVNKNLITSFSKWIGRLHNSSDYHHIKIWGNGVLNPPVKLFHQIERKSKGDLWKKALGIWHVDKNTRHCFF